LVSGRSNGASKENQIWNNFTNSCKPLNKAVALRLNHSMPLFLADLLQINLIKTF